MLRKYLEKSALSESGSNQIKKLNSRLELADKSLQNLSEIIIFKIWMSHRLWLVSNTNKTFSQKLK
jgi:hypothetical protein